MKVERQFYSPKDVATIFDMTIRQVYRHAKARSQGFPQPLSIGNSRKKTLRFNIADTMQCAVKWRVEE